MPNGPVNQQLRAWYFFCKLIHQTVLLPKALNKLEFSSFNPPACINTQITLTDLDIVYTLKLPTEMYYTYKKISTIKQMKETGYTDANKRWHYSTLYKNVKNSFNPTNKNQTDTNKQPNHAPKVCKENIMHCLFLSETVQYSWVGAHFMQNSRRTPFTRTHTLIIELAITSIW